MGAKTKALAALALMLAGKTFCAEKKIPFLTAGVRQKEIAEIPMAWDEKWFGKNPSTVYNHDMARFACLLAHTAYVDVLQNPADNVIVKNYRAIGVKDSDVEFKYDIDYTDSVWGNDQCAFSVASKEIDSALGKRTLVFLVIRGTPGNANEWISNLNINDDSKTVKTMHEGFARAAQQVYRALISYLLRHKIDPTESFLLVTGHSRGAAVANVIAAEISDDDFFKTSDVYAYTFAAPNVTTLKSATDEKYNYIWNIVNAEDCVPAVPLNTGKWTYRKYGRILTLVNYWNIDQDVYDNDYLPRVNKIYNALVNRDYCPFKMGPFIPAQVVEVFAQLNKSVDKYYSGGLGLRAKGEKIFHKIFAMPAQGNLETDEKIDIPKKATFMDKVISWANKATDGKVDFALRAFNDMHACETYFSWMLALDGSEAFSSLGYSQIILDGREEGAVYAKDGEMLARIIEGRVLISSIKTPVSGRSIYSGKIVVGCPGNMDFDFIVTNESILPTPIDVIVEHYDSNGLLVDSFKKKKLFPRENIVYKFEMGRTTLNSEAVDVQRIRGKAARKMSRDAELKPQQLFRLVPEFSLDTDLNFEMGFRVGSQTIYGSLLFDFACARVVDRFDIAQGAGTQRTLIGPVVLDLAAFLRYSWITSGVEDDENRFNIIPEARVGFMIRPTRYFSIFVNGIFDFHINSFNDAAFNSANRLMTMNEIDFGGGNGMATSIQCGIRF